MALPTQRHTSSKRKRINSHKALKTPTLTACRRCGSTVPRHQTCKNCGTYALRQVLPPPSPQSKSKSS